MYWCTTMFFPVCRTLHVPLLNFIKSLSAHLSSLLKTLRIAAQPSGVSTTPPSFVAPANLLRVHSASSERSDQKDRTHHSLLGYTAIYWPPTRLCAMDHHPLGPAVQPLFNPPHHLLNQPIYQQLVYEGGVQSTDQFGFSAT